MNLLRNDVYDLFVNMHVRITIYREFYYGIIYIANEGRHVRISFFFLTGHTNFLLATFENPASVSPYRMSTSYRRPAGGDSDHGYSTMTPHEDSEHASLPCSEPFISDRYKPVSYAITKSYALPPPPSYNSSRRSPTPPQTKVTNIYQPIPEQTIIPEINNVIANVQVHMVDTH